MDRTRNARSHREILTVPEVAAYLKLPVSTVYRLAERRELPGHKVGRQWRFHASVLDEWFREHSSAPRTTVLVVDDDEATRQFLASGLASSGRRVLTAGSGTEALRAARSTDVDLILLDLTVAGVDGVETFRRIHELKPDLPVVIISGYPNPELMARALEIGPFTIIHKPVDLPQIRKVMDLIAGGSRESAARRRPW